jgi:hypothetical protein
VLVGNQQTINKVSFHEPIGDNDALKYLCSFEAVIWLSQLIIEMLTIKCISGM